MMAIGENIRKRRKELGLSQSGLARRAEISRQALGAIETGVYQPTVGVALRLARELGESVESLFGGDTEPMSQRVDARWYRSVRHLSVPAGTRAALGRVRGRIVAVPQRAAGLALRPAAGIVAKLRGNRAEVAAFNSSEEIDSALLIAGCDPSASLLADWMIRYHSAARVVPVFSSNTKAVEGLVKGYVHCAGVHLKDAGSGDYNPQNLRALLGRRSALVVRFARWELGVAVRAGGRSSISSIADLAQPHLRLANREKGSGARAVLDSGLKTAGIRGSAIPGYDFELGGHLEVANAIVSGQADAGITLRVAAEAHGLRFVPIQEERYDLVILEADADTVLIKSLLDALSSRRFAREISQFCGYDTEEMGHVVARLSTEAAA